MARADREYSHLAPHVELGLEWRPRGGAVALSAEVRKTPPLGLGRSNRTDLFAAVVGVHADLAPRWGVDLEAGWRHVGFEDDQEVPNRLSVDFGPWVGVGVRATF